MVEHFVITRFNLRVESWHSTRTGRQVRSDAWLDERFNLFENFCLPSVKNQTDLDFIWCIFFDSETARSYRERVERMAASFKNIRLFYINGIIELVPSFQEFIRQTIKPLTRFVITTRLDNDDLVHRDFVREIKARFVPSHQVVIDLKKGYQLSIETPSPELRFLHNDFNPFISLIEDVSHVETVISRMHREWEKVERQVAVQDKRLWIELVHSSNKLNAVDRQNERIWKADLAEFGIPDNEFTLGSKWAIRSIQLRRKIATVFHQYIFRHFKQL